MDKQTKLKQVICEAVKPYLIRGILSGFETAILEALAKEGVVIKVDRELPCWAPIVLDGLVAVEPLIKDDK